jgi:ketosteroid isomerase-like protein
LDALYIRFVVFLVRNVAKPCKCLILGHTLAPCCFGREIREINVMRKTTMSRRTVLRAAPYALAAAAGVPKSVNAHPETALSPKNEETIRKWYAAWEKKDWLPVDLLLADDFTFSSAAGDDHISKSSFKTQCWETQIDFIERFDLQRIFGNGNEAFVMYLCRTKNGKAFRNVEYLRLKDDKVEAIECYFGAQSSFPSAVSTTKG